MYFCPLVPIPHLEELGSCRMALVLSHLVGDGDNYYTEFCRKLGESGTYIILDNGAYEAWIEHKSLPSLEETLYRAELVGAHEVQFLETFWDGRGTVDIVLSWIKAMDEEIRYRYVWHAIVQGKDQSDYTYCFEALTELGAVDVIGLPKVVTPHCFAEICNTKDLAITRICAVAMLVHKTTKPIHLLGLEDPREVLLQRKWGDRIRSVDSSFPIIHAVHGLRYSPDVSSYPTDLPRFDFHSGLSDSVIKLALHNLRTLRRWCGESKRKYDPRSGESKDRAIDRA